MRPFASLKQEKRSLSLSVFLQSGIPMARSRDFPKSHATSAKAGGPRSPYASARNVCDWHSKVPVLQPLNAMFGRGVSLGQKDSNHSTVCHTVALKGKQMLSSRELIHPADYKQTTKLIESAMKTGQPTE